MSHNDDIYDLGEVDHRAPRPVFGGSPLVAEQFEDRRPGARRRPLRAVRATSGHAATSAVGPALAGSLSIFVPGLGQMFAGELGWGLFYLTGIGFCAAAIWAVFNTLDSLVPMLRLLDVPAETLTATVGSLAFLTMMLHLTAILHAHSIASDDGRTPPHPLVAGISSLAIPGWGQLLAGHRARAALFLAGVWILGAAWLGVTPMGTQLLARLGLALPIGLRDGSGPIAMLAAPLALWTIAVYDAAAGAASERNRAF